MRLTIFKICREIFTEDFYLRIPNNFVTLHFFISAYRMLRDNIIIKPKGKKIARVNSKHTVFQTDAIYDFFKTLFPHFSVSPHPLSSGKAAANFHIDQH